MTKLRFLVAFIFALFLYSCQFSDSDFQYNVGNDFVKDPVKVIMIDTLSVNTYTTVFDSIPTSRNNRFMIGRAENKIGIITSCQSYFRIDPIAGFKLEPSSVFDSAILILNLDGYSFGDTTKVCKMEIYRLTEDINVNTETNYIYNTTQFAHESIPMATFSVDLSNKRLDSVVVRFDEFGKEMYDLVYNEDDLLDVIEGDPGSKFKPFKDKYKGFIIKPADNNISNVVGFVANPDSISSPKIKICYHDNTLYDDLSLVFEIEKFELTNSNGTSNINYYGSNYFTNDYSELISNGFPTSEGKLSSKETGNAIILQGGLNLRARIEIPTIDKLHYLGIGSVIKAELLFEPVNGSWEHLSDLPANLEMYLVNEKNEIIYDEYVNGQMNMIGSNDLAYAVLHYNNEFKNETYYSFDVTQYVFDEYSDLEDKTYSLLMTLPQSNINGNVNQLIIGDQNHTTNKMKLKVYMATY